MKVIVAGGSGFIGRKLIERLHQSQHEVILLSRKPEKVEKNFPSVVVRFWDAQTYNGLTNVIEGTDVIINLIGESIAVRRWTPAQKKRILGSRTESTRAIVDAIAQAKRKPSVLINASASGYYGNVPEGDVTETYQRGNGFLAEVCEKWEAEALKAREYGVRVVMLRSGVILDKKGGALQKLLLPFWLFIGGPFGSGRQWFPWIHIQDAANAILYAMENKKISGAINLAAPETVRMSEFCKALGNILHRPSFLPVPAFILKIVLGEMAEPLLLHGQKLVPEKLTHAGFNFQFANLEDALSDILH